MTASTGFFLGLAVGALLAVVALALAQAAGKTLFLSAEEEARKNANKKRSEIEEERQNAHATIDTLTREELTSVLSGAVSFDDVMRGRKDPSSPFFVASKPTGGGST